jgi:hypothetical protein
VRYAYIIKGKEGLLSAPRRVPLFLSGRCAAGKRSLFPVFDIVRMHKKIIYNLVKTPIVAKRPIKKDQALDNSPKKA